jgi:hypothetical protein
MDLPTVVEEEPVPMSTDHSSSRSWKKQVCRGRKLWIRREPGVAVEAEEDEREEEEEDDDEFLPAK